MNQETVHEHEKESEWEREGEEDDKRGEQDEAEYEEAGKGVQIRSNNSFRFRELVWEQRDGRWCSRWTWTEWEDYSVWWRRVEDGQERAIHAWDAADV